MAKKTGLIPQWTINEINAKIVKDTLEFKDQLTKSFQFMGERIVNDARQNANFTDRTGNLRHSIGYGVYENGSKAHSNYSGGGEGQNKAESLADLIGKKTKGIVLVVVAGMEYAGYVEARGYDVISGSLPEKSELEKDFKIFLKGI